jgi:transposase
MAQIVVTAGIDVSKGWLNAALWPTRAELQVEQSPSGYAQLAAWLTEQAVMRVGLEASGGYEIAAIDALETAGFEVVRFNTRRIRLFALAKGRLAKNDRADARTIAQATAVLLDQPPPARRRELDPLVEHLTYRRQLCAWITDCAHQLEHLRDAALRRTIARRRATLQRELAALELTLARLVAGDKSWRDLDRRLRQVPGIGAVSAQTLIAWLPELGHLSRRAIACLVGVAPFDDNSGKHTGERHIKGGRAAVRDVLYMAALTARRCNPVIARFA